MATDDCAILFVSEVPIFIDAGAYLLCELVSGGKKRAYRIEWKDALVAMGRCGNIVEEHFGSINADNVWPINGA